ncbi:unnamed protein product [Lepeophtheirus salmonis]|uniref:Cilia- and flagella-associated protein 299 n=1 Tax=Lepeophtheirus salmonis TaxID=72036 RepID=A0A7R8CRZ4_LEPSM|nr:unnamed protein product [Lepeophtheirus salmonis]CAF2907638.1 unnamed protein product [Lepeophtheirus salmonis]
MSSLVRMDMRKTKKDPFMTLIECLMTKKWTKYATYEEYLDSLVSEEDHRYLEDEDMARIIAELGYRSSGISFLEKKNKAIETEIVAQNNESESGNESSFLKALKNPCTPNTNWETPLDHIHANH